MLTTRMSPQVTCSLNDSSLEKFYKLERSLKLNGVGETKQVIHQRLLLIFDLIITYWDRLTCGVPASSGRSRNCTMSILLRFSRTLAVNLVKVRN